MESLHQNFSLKFYHDIRYATNEFQASMIPRYAPMLVKVITDSYCLLTRQHQVILSYMLTQNWSSRDVLNFFLRDFVLVVLLRYAKSTPFKQHFWHLKMFSAQVHADSKYFGPILEVIRTGTSAVEIPCGFDVFRSTFYSLVFTPADVDILVKPLAGGDALPVNLKMFLLPDAFLREIDYQAFWVRIYPRNSHATQPHKLWRPVVFGTDISDFEIEENPVFERMLREIVENCNRDGDTPLERIRESPVIRNMLGDARMEQFEDFVLRKSLRGLSDRAVAFEEYLVNSMYFKSLQTWWRLVRSYLDIILNSNSAEIILHELERAAPSKLGDFEDLLPYVGLRPELQLGIAMQAFLPFILTKERIAQFNQLQGSWNGLTQAARRTLVLPESYQNLRIQQYLWESIEHLRSLNYVEFGGKLRIFMESLSAIRPLGESDDLALRFAIVYCDCARLVCDFLLVNALLVRNPRVKIWDDNDDRLVLWFWFEAAILRLMTMYEQAKSHGPIMPLYLRIQDDLIALRAGSQPGK
jgi:hypothetical protein